MGLPKVEFNRAPSNASCAWSNGVLARVFRAWHGAASIVLLAAVYYYVGRFGLSLAFLHPSATPVWPPTGIALAAFLLFGHRLWPGVLIGALVLNYTTAGSFGTSASIAFGNTAEALIGAWLVCRFAAGRRAFDKTSTIFKFVFFAGMLSTAVSASVGVTSLCLSGFAAWEDYLPIWLTWWLGDMASDLILTPLLLVWNAKPLPRPGAKQLAEASSLVLLAFVMAQLVFAGWLSFFTEYPLSFLCIPPVLLAAYRFGPHGAVTTVFLVSTTAIWGTLSGFGPFAFAGPNQSLVLLQAFMATIALTAAVLATVVNERRQTEAALRQSSTRLLASEQELRELNRKLEQRVAERTASLEETHHVLMRDIEQRLRLEEQLRQTERLSALGLATAKIVHEIGNPLNGISTTAQVLERHFNSNPFAANPNIGEVAAGLRSEIERLKCLLDEIRSFSSPNANALKREPIDLSTLAAQVLAQEEPYCRDRGVQFVRDLPTDLPAVLIDRKKMTQVLLNLYKNAAEAMPEGGTLTVRAYPAGEHVCIDVVDTGIGIPEHVNIFEPLTTTKATGMGIGLAVVKQFVEAHDGTIRYTSEPGKGTTFRLTLPLEG